MRKTGSCGDVGVVLLLVQVAAVYYTGMCACVRWVVACVSGSVAGSFVTGSMSDLKCMNWSVLSYVGTKQMQNGRQVWLLDSVMHVGSKHFAVSGLWWCGEYRSLCHWCRQCLPQCAVASGCCCMPVGMEPGGGATVQQDRAAGPCPLEGHLWHVLRLCLPRFRVRWSAGLGACLQIAIRISSAWLGFGYAYFSIEFWRVQGAENNSWEAGTEYRSGYIAPWPSVYTSSAQSLHVTKLFSSERLYCTCF